MVGIHHQITKMFLHKLKHSKMSHEDFLSQLIVICILPTTYLPRNIFFNLLPSHPVPYQHLILSTMFTLLIFRIFYIPCAYMFFLILTPPTASFVSLARQPDLPAQRRRRPRRSRPERSRVGAGPPSGYLQPVRQWPCGGRDPGHEGRQGALR